MHPTSLWCPPSVPHASNLWRHWALWEVNQDGASILLPVSSTPRLQFPHQPKLPINFNFWGGLHKSFWTPLHPPCLLFELSHCGEGSSWVWARWNVDSRSRNGRSFSTNSGISQNFLVASNILQDILLSQLESTDLWLPAYWEPEQLSGLHVEQE